MTPTGWGSGTWRAGLWVAALCGGMIAAAGLSGACAAAGNETRVGDDDDGGTGASGGGGGAGGGHGGAGGGSTGGGGEGGAMPACEEDPCKLTEPQCGCSTGEQCTVVGAVVTCGPEGDVAPGEACGTCTPGHYCLNNLTGGAPICHRFCDDDDDCSGPGALCIYPLSGGLATLCSQNCDPVSDTGCEVASMKCDIAQEAGGDMRWFTRCTGSGTIEQGGICTNGNQCAKGLGCFGLQGRTDQLCLTWCKVASPNCPTDTQCASFTTPILVGTLEYGACVPTP